MVTRTTARVLALLPVTEAFIPASSNCMSCHDKLIQGNDSNEFSQEWQFRRRDGSYLITIAYANLIFGQDGVCKAEATESTSKLIRWIRVC